LDVGGGSAPYCGSSHIIDIQPYNKNRLLTNAWGTKPPEIDWQPENYTEIDICSKKTWPFDDKEFDLGLCSHTLEDIRDPISPLMEMMRVSKKILVICPSRLVEQTMGFDHPAYTGYFHHRWMVSFSETQALFQRKTGLLQLKGAHGICPVGYEIKKELASTYYYGSSIEPVEIAFWNEQLEFSNLNHFVKSVDWGNAFTKQDNFTLKKRIWKFRQKLTKSL